MEEQDISKQNRVSTPIQNLIQSTQKDSTVGPMIGSIIVIVILLVGGLYFLGSIISSKKTEIQTEQAQQEQLDTQQIEQTVKQSNSDDVSSIEADLKSTNIDNLDKEINNLDKEF